MIIANKKAREWLGKITTILDEIPRLTLRIKWLELQGKAHHKRLESLEGQIEALQTPKKLSPGLAALVRSHDTYGVDE